ncbi:hypothetical protein DM01DRAFT_1312440 [Hesseltinella vesiculosa]|uniref:RING-type domain-containing protein n=1 Tax=Hesseltinella vesiculosa TaxID=101127 RepID=A0A1X2G469_9FUNG|nr:hypothetical protein DM01DRAFT_1312440 [Hesseltinella vesiculosa]
MYCDKPLRIFLTVHILRLVLSSPLAIYLHLSPRQQQRPARHDNNAERGESFAMTDLQSNNVQPLSIPSNAVHTPNITPPSHTIAPLPVTPMIYPSPPPHSSLLSWIDRAKSALDLFATLWFIIGNYMLFTSTTCSETAKPIYYLSLTIIVYGYIIITVPLLLCTAVIFCLPCVLVGMRLIHVDDGIDMGGATQDDIDRIPVFRFRSNKPPPPPPPRRLHPQLHHPQTHKQQQNSENTSKIAPTVDYTTPLDKVLARFGWLPSPSEQTNAVDLAYDELEIPNEQDQVCAICLSTYEDSDILCRLWCYHHFHKTCVSEWLVLNSRCPLCKRDCRRHKDQLSSVIFNQPTGELTPEPNITIAEQQPSPLS